MDKIRVGQIIAGFSIENPLGGIERFVIELCRSIDKSYISPIAIGLWKFENIHSQKWITLLNSLGIPTVECADWNKGNEIKNFMDSLKKLLRELSVMPVDIFHSHSQFGDIMGIFVKIKNRKVKLARTVHNNYEWAKRPIRKLILTGILFPLLYDVEIGVNNKIVSDLNSRILARMLKKRSLRIPNASNLSNFINVSISIEEKKRSLNIDETRLIVGTVGRLHYQKGFDILLHSVPRVIKEFPNVLFLFIGDGPLNYDLLKLQSEEGLQHCVRFLGARNDVGELLRIMDLFVSSSRWEGLPSVLLESMASGVPIVATNVPGTDELITHGKNGWLVEPESPLSLAEGIIYLLSKSQKRKEFVEESREVVKEYDISSVAAQYEAIYKSLMEDIS